MHGHRLLAVATGACLTLALGACRGGISEEPPIHPVLDMDFQASYRSQEASDFEGWPDHRAMRLPVPGTVARGSLRQGPLYEYKLPDGSYVTQNPLPLTLANLQRGKERFEITCSLCHGLSGRGGTGPDAHGIVGRRWPSGVRIPSFIAEEGMDNRVAELADGEYFEVITGGRNTMPAYGRMIAVEDRWAIIHYIRALQKHAEQQ